MANPYDHWNFIASLLSAIAAIGAAVAAWFSYRHQQLSEKNAVRPEIEIEHIALSETSGVVVLTIGKVRNCGRGPAQFVRAELEMKRGGQTTPVEQMIGSPVPILHPDEMKEVEWKNNFRWSDGVNLRNQGYVVFFELRVCCLDLFSNLYEARNSFIACEKKDMALDFGDLSWQVSDKLFLSQRTIRSTSLLRRRVRTKVLNAVTGVNTFVHRIKKFFTRNAAAK